MAEAMVRAEAETQAEAARRCADQGGPVRLDRGVINILQNGRWQSITTFTCRVPATPAGN